MKTGERKSVQIVREEANGQQGTGGRESHMTQRTFPLMPFRFFTFSPSPSDTSQLRTSDSRQELTGLVGGCSACKSGRERERG